MISWADCPEQRGPCYHQPLKCLKDSTTSPGPNTSEASGTPVADFMGVPHGGKRFSVMTIDIHTVEAGKLVRAHHVEDWAGALRQLRG